jgi:hypothetical protein
MLTANQFALKEWAVVIRALASGRQTILLRKGGIRDEAGGFQLEHREFFLYPTFEHQNRQFLREEFLGDFDQAIREQPTGERLVLAVYAEVTDIFMARDLDVLHRLNSFHVWNDEFLERRFDYKPEIPLRVLIARAYEVQGVEIALRPRYTGCRSWVELDRELPVTEPRPAFAADEFAWTRASIKRQILAHQPTTMPIQPA